MNIFPVSHLPMPRCFLKFLLLRFLFSFSTLKRLPFCSAVPIGKLHFQISNCNVFIFVTLAFVIMVSYCILSNTGKIYFPDR